MDQSNNESNIAARLGLVAIPLLLVVGTDTFLVTPLQLEWWGIASGLISLGVSVRAGLIRRSANNHLHSAQSHFQEFRNHGEKAGEAHDKQYGIG